MKDLDTWQREVAAGIAQAHPLEKVRFKSEEVKAPKLVYLMGADVRFAANAPEFVGMSDDEEPMAVYRGVVL